MVFGQYSDDIQIICIFLLNLLIAQAKKKDDPKLMKAEEKNADARRMYESLNQVR